jgi:hypothetical protein
MKTAGQSSVVISGKITDITERITRSELLKKKILLFVLIPFSTLLSAQNIPVMFLWCQKIDAGFTGEEVSANAFTDDGLYYVTDLKARFDLERGIVSFTPWICSKAESGLNYNDDPEPVCSLTGYMNVGFDVSFGISAAAVPSVGFKMETAAPFRTDRTEARIRMAFIPCAGISGGVSAFSYNTSAAFKFMYNPDDNLFLKICWNTVLGYSPGPVGISLSNRMFYIPGELDEDDPAVIENETVLKVSPSSGAVIPSLGALYSYSASDGSGIYNVIGGVIGLCVKRDPWTADFSFTGGQDTVGDSFISLLTARTSVRF